MIASMPAMLVVVGCSLPERRWIRDTRPSWGDNFLPSGMEAGSGNGSSRRAWRFSPSLPATAAAGPSSRGSPWDPHSLVRSQTETSLVLGPLALGSGKQHPHAQKPKRQKKEGNNQETMLVRGYKKEPVDCWLSFAQGVVLEIMTAGPLRSGGHEGPQPSASPFGLWLDDPQSAPMPTVHCDDDDEDAGSTWPLQQLSS